MALVPPIKSQGIKTKLVPWIIECANSASYTTWVEPFMGTGVVAFNVRPRQAMLCDSNPHIIAFYNAIKNKEITSNEVKSYLVSEGLALSKSQGEHYYLVRERFNKHKNPLDFLFLSRSCFNGMIRFNKSGGFNVPFCKKPERFSQALVTKITNQVSNVSRVIEMGEYVFLHQDFSETIKSTTREDLVYCDPPYIGRHVDYYDSWTEDNELNLNGLLHESGAKFILSTWLENKYRRNEYVFDLWKDCSILVKEHFYHVGGKERNRNAVYEALLSNFSPKGSFSVSDIANREYSAEQTSSMGGLRQSELFVDA